MENQPRPNGAYTMFYLDNIRSDVIFEGNNITGNGYNYMWYIYSPYDDIEIIDNYLSENSGNNYAMYTRYLRYDMKIKDNVFFNNSFNGGFIFQQYNYNTYIIEDNEWSFTLDSKWMNFKGLKTPKVMMDKDEDPDGLFYEKFFLIDQALAAMNTIYAAFIKSRTSPEWESEEIPALRAWIGEGR